MAKVQAKCYVEQDVWDGAQRVWAEQGVSNSVGLERVLSRLIEADHETRLLMLGQAGGGDFRQQLAESILEAARRRLIGSPKNPDVAGVIRPNAERDAARTDPEARHKPRRPKD